MAARAFRVYGDAVGDSVEILTRWSVEYRCPRYRSTGSNHQWFVAQDSPTPCPEKQECPTCKFWGYPQPSSTPGEPKP